MLFYPLLPCDSRLKVPGKGGCQHFHKPSGCQVHFRSLGTSCPSSAFVLLPFWKESARPFVPHSHNHLLQLCFTSGEL